MLKNKFFRFVPVIIWMSTIFYFSSQSTAVIHGTSTTRFLILKSFHLIEYAILAILLFLAYQKPLPSIITAYLFALSDEFHQFFIPGRTSKFQDTLIDLLGIILGLLLLKFLLSFKSVKKFLNAIY